MKKIKKSVYLVIIMLLGVVGLTAYAVTAWLTDTDTTGPSTFTVGDVEYSWSGELVTSTHVVPGQELVDVNDADTDEEGIFQLTNASNVASELRVKITAVTNYPAADTDALGLLTLVLGSNWALNSDGYYYYIVTGSPDNPIIAAGAQVLPVLISLKLDGSKVGNDYTGATFTLTLMFEAKQAAYVTWEQLGTANIDFSTGLETQP